MFNCTIAMTEDYFRWGMFILPEEILAKYPFKSTVIFTNKLNEKITSDQQRSAIGAVEPVTGRGALLGVQAREEAVDAGGGRFSDGARGERGGGHGDDEGRL